MTRAFFFALASVIPAKAGIQALWRSKLQLDSRFHGNDSVMTQSHDTMRRTLGRSAAVIGCIALLSACNKSPFDRTKNASGGGALGRYGVAGGMVIFSDELKSGGGAFLYPGPENQSLSFSDRSNPISARSIRYSWNGQPVSNTGCTPDPTYVFAGFDLMHTPTLASYTSTPGHDLSHAGYGKVTFYARGSLSTNTVLKIEVAAKGPSGACSAFAAPCINLHTHGSAVTDDGSAVCDDSHELSSDWQAYTISGLTPTQLSSVKDFFKATFVFVNTTPGSTQPGQGGTAYFDQIVYQP